MLFWTFMFLFYANDASSVKPASFLILFFAQQVTCDSLFSTILCTVILYRSFDKIFMPLILQRYCKWTLFVQQHTFLTCSGHLSSHYIWFI